MVFFCLFQEINGEFLPLIFFPKLVNSTLHAKRHLINVVENIVASYKRKSVSFMNHIEFLKLAVIRVCCHKSITPFIYVFIYLCIYYRLGCSTKPEASFTDRQ